MLKSEDSLSLLKSFRYVPQPINYNGAPSDDVIYSKSTKWSKCRRKCRQVRRRRCIDPERCGNTKLKETRPCSRRRSCKNQSRRAHRKNKPVQSQTGEWQHIVRKKKLSKKSKGKLRKNNAFYSKWSKWTRCSDKCTTARTKECNFETLCGLEKVIEEAYCYIKGSQCQSWHRQGKFLTL